MKHVKYQRTPHLPWSEGASSDDIFTDINDFIGQEVVVTEKLDGECTTMYNDLIHARSISSKDHPSRSWVKGLHGKIKHEIPENMRICGENLYAKHSIFYEELPSYFMVFAIYEENTILSWDETKEWCSLLGLYTVPELYIGQWNENEIRRCQTGFSKYKGSQEGYVVRTASGSHFAKFVRKGHVQTSEHWLNMAIIPNKLKG